MKNYLVKALHRVEDFSKTHNMFSHNASEEMYQMYSEMEELSRASFFHFLKGDWEFISLVGHSKDLIHAVRQQFIGIWKIWQSEPCNILYCGSDTQMLKPTEFEVFHQYNDFMLFNYTSLNPIDCGIFKHFLNCDIRYYPSSMRKELWDWALPQARVTDKWNQEQTLYNHMVWSQGLGHEKIINTQLAYQGKLMNLDNISDEYSDIFNSNHKFKDAHIVHWHGSPMTIDLMKYMDSRLGIPKATNNIVSREVDISYIL